MAFTDSHAHLDDTGFDSDRAEVVARAQRAGVERILTMGNGTEASHFQKTLELVEQNPSLCK